MWGGDDEDVTDSGKHEHRNRIVDHRFVIDRKHLLRYAFRDGIQARAGTAGEYYAFHNGMRLSPDHPSGEGEMIGEFEGDCIWL